MESPIEQVDPSAQAPQGQVADPSPAADPVAEQVDPSPEELLEQSLAGTFEEPVAQPQAEPQDPAPAQAQTAGPDPLPAKNPWDEAPTNWPQAEREAFAALPADQREFVFGTVTSAHRAAQEKMDHAAELRRTVADFVQRMGQPQPTPQDSEPEPQGPPEDPVERIKWDAKQEVLQELDKRAVKDRERQLEIDRQQTIQKVSTDPLYAHVKQQLDAEYLSKPNLIDPSDPKGRTYQQVEYDKLNSDPQYFRARYLAHRERISAMQQQHTAPQQSPTHTPQLEKAGVTTSAPVVNPERKVHDGIIRNIRKGKVTPQTLGQLLENTVSDSAFA